MTQDRVAADSCFTGTRPSSHRLSGPNLLLPSSHHDLAPHHTHLCPQVQNSDSTQPAPCAPDSCFLLVGLLSCLDHPMMTALGVGPGCSPVGNLGRGQASNTGGVAQLTRCPSPQVCLETKPPGPNPGSAIC